MAQAAASWSTRDLYDRFRLGDSELECALIGELTRNGPECLSKLAVVLCEPDTVRIERALHRLEARGVVERRPFRGRVPRDVAVEERWGLKLPSRVLWPWRAPRRRRKRGEAMKLPRPCSPSYMKRVEALYRQLDLYITGKRSHDRRYRTLMGRLRRLQRRDAQRIERAHQPALRKLQRAVARAERLLAEHGRK